MPTTIETLQEVADTWGVDLEAVTDFADWIGETDLTLDRADEFFDSYLGRITAREYAEQMVEESGAISPSWLEPYVDYDAIAHDLQMEGYYESPGGYLFRPY